MRNGSTVEGVIVAQSRTHVRVRENGRVRAIPKTQIRRIKYGPDESAKRRAEEAARKRRAERERKAELLRREKEEKRAAAVKSLEKATGKKEQGPAARGEEPHGLLWRSLVLPGWGFLHAGGNDAWGWAYMAGFGGGLLLGAAQLNRARSAKATYNEAAGGLPAFLLAGNNSTATLAVLYLNQSSDNRNFQVYQQQSARFNALAVFTALIYVVQAVHVNFLTSPTKTAGADAPSRLTFSVGLSGDGAAHGGEGSEFQIRAGVRF